MTFRQKHLFYVAFLFGEDTLDGNRFRVAFRGVKFELLAKNGVDIFGAVEFH